MVVVDTHPSIPELEAFALGTLDDATFAAVETHVAGCSICQERAAESSGDNLVAVLRRIHVEAARLSDTMSQTQTPRPVPAGAVETKSSYDCIPPELERHDRYRVIRLLGAGGMGSVFEAEHRVMQRAVAIKVINSAYTSRPAAVERFRREVRAAARLAHPNIVTTYDAEDAGNTLFLAMEYVEGISLAHLVKKRGPLPVAEACDYVRQAALGLQHAHERGMVHRDVKPDNLIRTVDGQVKVLDFGLAALTAERDGDPTEANAVMGTPDYMAPEQAEAPQSADIRADVYSLGCTLYYLLTGNVPYPAATSVLKINAHRQHPLPDIRKVNPEVPPALAGIMSRLLAKKPESRYETPGEVAAALAAFALNEEDKKRYRKRGRLFAAVALFFGLLFAGAVYRVQTDKGELVITTESDDVKVVILQGGKQIDIVDTKSDKQITLELRSGDYQLELKGRPQGLKLNIDEAILTRGTTVLARIERTAKPAQLTHQAPAKDAIQLVHRVDWRTNGVLVGAFVAPRGRYFLAAISSLNGLVSGVRVWDGETGKSLWEQSNSHWAQFSPDGKQVYTLETGSWTVRAYHTATGELVREVCSFGKLAFGFYLTADGKYLIAECDGTQSVWSVADGKMLREWPRNPWTFAADGESINLAGEEGACAHVFRLPTFEEVVLPKPFAAFAPVYWQPAKEYAIAPEPKSPPESWWLVKADGQKVRRWVPAAYGKMLATSSCPWVNDRESLVSLDDGTLRLFDVLTHQERASFRLPPGEHVVRTEPSSDGGFVGATTNKGGVLMFRLPDPPAAKGKS